jgi:hypothetical protein
VEMWDDCLLQKTRAALIWDMDTFNSHHTPYRGLLTDKHVLDCLKSSPLEYNANQIISTETQTLPR